VAGAVHDGGAARAPGGLGEDARPNATTADDAMKKVSIDEIVGLQRYEEVRPAFRQRIIELKKHRRVAVGDRITFVFENHDTMLFQVQEMLRAERIVDIDRVRDELDVYNALVPQAGEFSCTMLIEITDAQRVRAELMRLIGIDESVCLRIGERFVCRGEFEAGHSKEDKLSAVQYVRFRLTADLQRAFVEGREPVFLTIDHPNYQATAPIDGAVRESLAHDLAAA
jgi:hypothetical protein